MVKTENSVLMLLNWLRKKTSPKCNTLACGLLFLRTDLLFESETVIAHVEGWGLEGQKHDPLSMEHDAGLNLMTHEIMT